MEYYWTGENDPPEVDNFCCSPPTEEEKKMSREAELREIEEYMEERKKIQEEKRNRQK